MPGDYMRRFANALKRLFRRNLPEDPYAYVGAPNRPRLPQRSATALADPPRLWQFILHKPFDR